MLSVELSGNPTPAFPLLSNAEIIKTIFPSLLLVNQCSALIEAAARIQSGTDDEVITGQAIDELKELAKDRIEEIVYLDKYLTEQCISFAIGSKLGAIEAIIATCCLMGPATLVTNEDELYRSVMNIPSEPEMGYRTDAYLLHELKQDQLEKLFDP